MILYFHSSPSFHEIKKLFSQDKPLPTFEVDSLISRASTNSEGDIKYQLSIKVNFGTHTKKVD